MRRLLILIVIMAVLGLGAALLIPLVLDAEAWRGRIERVAGEQLGREVSIDGEMRFAVLPRIQVRAHDVSVANADGFSATPFARMDELRVGLAVGPLLRREIVVDELVLVGPDIRLEQRGQARNWEFAPEGEAPPPRPEGFRRPGALPFEARLGDVRIEDGALGYVSGDESWRITDLNARLDLPDFDGPARLEGDFALNGEAMGFDVRLGSLRGFMEGARTSLGFNLSGEAVRVRFDGEAAESSEPDFDGEADVDIALRRLAAMLDADMAPGQTFNRLTASGRLSVRPGRASLDEARVRFDAIEATGRLAADYAGPRPRVTGRLGVETLDLNPYLPEQREDTPGDQNGEWSDEPIELEPLRLIDAELDATAGRLIFNDIEITDVALRAVLDNGRLAFDLDRYGLYGGTGRARGVVNARGNTPSYTLNASLDGLQAQPFLEAAADFTRLIGTGGLTLDLAASGDSPAAIMNSLSGRSRFDFSDGAITGVNLAQVIRTVQTAVQTRQLPSGFGETEQTDFTSLGGSVDIANGVARNLDLAMLSPLLRVDGAGEIDLPGQSIDYRLTPRAVRSLTGQGGEADLQGLAVPIRITGGFGDPSIAIDFEAVIADLARAQAGRLIGGQLGQQLGTGQSLEDSARGAAQDLLRGALGGRQPAQTDEETAQTEEDQAETPSETREDPARQLIDGLFGRSRSQREEPGG